MGIRVECGNCGVVTRVPDDSAGRRGQCRGCGASVVVPGTRPTIQPGAAPVRSRAWRWLGLGLGVVGLVLFGVAVGWGLRSRPGVEPVPALWVPDHSVVDGLLGQARDLQRQGKFRESGDLIDKAIEASGFNEHDLPACFEQRADLFEEWKPPGLENAPANFRSKARELREQYAGRK